MMKWLPAFVFFLAASNLLAQDMPPLPPLPNQGQVSAPATTAPPAGAAPSDNTQPSALPPLPNQAPATNAAPPSAPPLPDQSATAAPATTAPSDNNAAATAPSTETAAATPEANPAPKKISHGNPFIHSKYRPNVLFGGWVRAKGGNETSRMAWTSQEVLNALIFKKYKLVSPDQGKPEEGNYQGQPGRQWREFNFIAPKSELAVQVYIRQDANKKVWLRVGPDEGVFPAETSLMQSKKMREADLAVLHLLQKKFGRRLSPKVVPTWEAPYRYSVASADE